MAKVWILIAALLGAGAVTLGAYHAHGLKESLEDRGLESHVVEKRLQNCDTAVRYQMYHALAIFGIGILLGRCCTTMGSIAAGLMFVGVLGFSGGLYASVFGTPLPWFVVPIGGLLMILGWLMLAVAGFSLKGECAPSKQA